MAGVIAAIKATALAKRFGGLFLPGLVAVAILSAWRISGAISHKAGVKSRDGEVMALKDKVTKLDDKVLKLEQNYVNLKAEADLDKLKVIDLSGKLVAKGEEHAAALKLQAASARAAQNATDSALKLVAAQSNAREGFFAALSDKTKGLGYDIDEDGRCIVRGAGGLLRGAAKGK